MSAPMQDNRLLPAENAVAEDSDEDERDKKFGPPPAYFKHFLLSKDAMAPPDLENLLKKDYIILYQRQKKVPLRGTLSL